MQNNVYCVEISISRHSPRFEVISDHPEASQGDLEINQFCESWKKSDEHTSLVSQDKSQNESDNALANLVRSWQKSRWTDKPCEPYQKSS